MADLTTTDVRVLLRALRLYEESVTQMTNVPGISPVTISNELTRINEARGRVTDV